MLMTPYGLTKQLWVNMQLEQLECLRSEDTPRRLMITHTIESYWIPKFQIFEFWNGHYTRHTFWSCLIRCANMKWIQWVSLKIQGGHDSVHRRTDGQTDRRTDGQGDTSIPPFQLRWSGGYNKMHVQLFTTKIWTHWGRVKMVDILKTFSNPFSFWKHCTLFLITLMCVQSVLSIISQYW